MSWSNQFPVENPTSAFYEFSQKHETFVRFDKASQQEVPIESGEFIFIRQRMRVTGHSEKYGLSIRGTEGENINSHLVANVFLKAPDGKYNKIELVRGTWADNKADFKEVGGKYCAMIYAALIKDQMASLVCLECKGAGLSFLDFKTKNFGEFGNHLIKIEGVTEEKKGTNKYLAPVFGLGRQMEDQHRELAIQLYNRLDNYIQSYDQEQLKALAE